MLSPFTLSNFSSQKYILFKIYLNSLCIFSSFEFLLKYFNTFFWFSILEFITFFYRYYTFFVFIGIKLCPFCINKSRKVWRGYQNTWTTFRPYANFNTLSTSGIYKWTRQRTWRSYVDMIQGILEYSAIFLPLSFIINLFDSLPIK